MTDETFSVFAALSALAAGGALWFRFQQARGMRRLLRSLEEQRSAPALANEPAALLARAAEELETAKRLLTEADNVGLWVKADDCSDNQQKREKLRGADWAASGAQRALAALRSQSPEVPAAALEDDVRALVALLEPLPDMVTDTMASNPALNERIRVALEKVNDIAGRLGRNPASDIPYRSP